MSTPRMEPGRHAFFDAVRTGRTAELEQMLDNAPELTGAYDDSGISAVRTALYYEQPAALELLRGRVEMGLHDAAALGETQRLRELLDGGNAFADAASPDGYTPLQLAAHYGRTDAVALLLEHGAGVDAVSPNPQRSTALHMAASRGHLDAARLLLDAGANPNARDQHGNTPLHAAAKSGNALLLGLLHQSGADAEALNADHQTAADVLNGIQYNESE